MTEMTETKERADMLTTAQAQEYLRVNRHTFEKHIRPHVPRIVLGRKHFYTKVDLEVWLEKMKTPSVSARRSIYERFIQKR
jgi:hypothetical protein